MRFGDLNVRARITFEDGNVVETPEGDKPIDRLMFERKYDMPWLGWDSLREEYLLFMAWVQLQRDDLARGVTPLSDFEVWMLSVDRIEIDVLEGDAALPTVPAASTG